MKLGQQGPTDWLMGNVDRVQISDESSILKFVELVREQASLNGFD